MMQLIFEKVLDATVRGVPCTVQRAEVTDNGYFWAWWRKGESPLKKLLSLRVEDGKYYVYRAMPNDPTLIEKPPLPPYTLRNPRGLLRYQYRAVSALTASLLRHGKAFDGSDTGTGKTYVFAATARELGMKAGVICIKSNIAVWEKVLASFGVEALFVTNWEMIKRRKGNNAFCRYNERYGTYEWNLPSGTLLAFDEAHMANHPGSLNYKLYTASKPYPSVTMSATIADKLERLQHVFHLFNIVPEHQFSTWLRSRGHVEHPYNDMELEGLSDTQDMAEVGRYLYSNYGCRLSVGDPDVKRYFPDVIYEARLIDIGKNAVRKQNRLYEDMVKRVLDLYQQGKSAEAITANLRYRQSAELMKSHAIAELALNYMKTGHSVVIFVNFLDTLNYLSHLLHTESLIYGSQKIPREKIIEDFQADRTPLIIAMIGAGGQSISLHDLHGRRRRVSLMCPTYNPIHIKQALGRTYRARAKTPPLIQLVYTSGTIEEQVSQRVAMKIRAIDSLNSGDLIETDIFNLLGDTAQ